MTGSRCCLRFKPTTMPGRGSSGRIIHPVNTHGLETSAPNFCSTTTIADTDLQVQVEMSGHQKKEEKVSRFSRVRHTARDFLRAGSWKTSRRSRASSPASTPDSTQTLKDYHTSGNQSPTSNPSLDLSSKPEAVATELLAAAPGPANALPEPSHPEPATYIAEKTRQVILQRLGKEIVDQQDPSIVIRAVRKDLEEYNTQHPRQQTVGRMLKRVDEYLVIVDIAIQHHPDVKNPLFGY